jgi:hypothetical protein
MGKEGISPLMRELEAIKEHPIKTHTILIDDIRCANGQSLGNITLDMIIQKIWEINPDYRLVFENGYVPKDILVAKIEDL